MRALRAAAALAAVAAACGVLPAFAQPDSLLGTVRVATGLNAPVYATAPDGDPRLFIVEQRGVVRILENGVLRPTPFLDIDSLVAGPETSSERGLLGLAFHPDYGTNGRFFVHYTDLDGNTAVAEYVVSGDPNLADHGSKRIVLGVRQPYANHNGGQLEFGPLDGYLYLSLGDGGLGGDPEDRAQNPDSLLGKILRLDVDGVLPYAVPPTNPFVGVPGARPEIWALGLRNPYRTCFDRVTGDLWIADVGQGAWEEVSFEPAGSPGGANYGWDLMEGRHCFPPSSSCLSDTLVLPVIELDHGGGRCAVTGGRVYRGNGIPWLRGTYFYGDWCSDQIWSLRYDGITVTDSTERTQELAPNEPGAFINSITGFAEDGFGELYVVDGGGELYRIVDRSAAPPDSVAPSLSILGVSPNPFGSAVQFSVLMPRDGRLEVTVHGANGRRVRQLARMQAAAGTEPLRWDGRDDGGVEVPSGIYLLRAAANGETATRKIERLR